jgi:hypothetical protein
MLFEEFGITAVLLLGAISLTILALISKARKAILDNDFTPQDDVFTVYEITQFSTSKILITAKLLQGNFSKGDKIKWHQSEGVIEKIELQAGEITQIDHTNTFVMITISSVNGFFENKDQKYIIKQ